MTQQPTLALHLGPVVAPNGLYWTCGDCLPITNGLYSYVWQPLDATIGICEHCKDVVHFPTPYGGFAPATEKNQKGD